MSESSTVYQFVDTNGDWPYNIHVEGCRGAKEARYSAKHHNLTPNEVAQNSYHVLFDNSSLPHFEGNTFADLETSLVRIHNCLTADMKREIKSATFTRMSPKEEEALYDYQGNAESFNAESFCMTCDTTDPNYDYVKCDCGTVNCDVCRCGSCGGCEQSAHCHYNTECGACGKHYRSEQGAESFAAYSSAGVVCSKCGQKTQQGGWFNRGSSWACQPCQEKMKKENKGGECLLCRWREANEGQYESVVCDVCARYRTGRGQEAAYTKTDCGSCGNYLYANELMRCSGCGDSMCEECPGDTQYCVGCADDYNAESFGAESKGQKVYVVSRRGDDWSADRDLDILGV